MASLIRKRLKKGSNPELIMVESQARIKTMERLDPHYKEKCKRKCLAYQNAAKRHVNNL